MGGEQTRDLAPHGLLHPLRVGPGGETQAHPQVRRGGLHDLGQLTPPPRTWSTSNASGGIKTRPPSSLENVSTSAERP